MGLPNGTTVSVGSDGDWAFPTGTVLMILIHLFVIGVPISYLARRYYAR